MNTTPRLQLPYIASAQAQKHVTHNEALRKLDALTQISVIDRTLAAPPGSPAEGDRHLVAAGPTGLWAGKENQIAVLQDGAWIFYPPLEGWLAWVEAEARLLVWQGTAWAEVTGLNGSLPMLGINAGADATNRLALASACALFSHDGADHRLKINKAAAANTASLVFQNGFSGRAELGLNGSDDFSFKVSADGSVWSTAVTIDRSSGAVSFPNTTVAGGREKLSANRTYYVRPDGSDSNNGLVNTAGGAFFTIGKAVSTAQALDLSNFNVTIQLADGTYNETVMVTAPFLGTGMVTIKGNAATPANVIVGSATASGFSVSGAGTRLAIQDLRPRAGASGNAIEVRKQGYLAFSNLSFPAIANAHLLADSYGIAECTGSYAIAGGAASHISMQGPSEVIVLGVTVTLSGTPAFTTFADCNFLGFIKLISNTFSGTATGKRHNVVTNGVIQANGATLPGSIAGTTATGGQYS